MKKTILIKDLPPHIQELIHKRQREQGNDGTFDGNIGEFRENGNFNWYITPEYDSLWWSLSLGEPVKSIQHYIDINPRKL